MAPRARVRIGSRLGLHARPCALLASLARRHRGELTLVLRERRASAKSIFDLMLLAAARGDEVELEATGDDADGLLAAALELLAKDLDEGQA
jgi:phosphotransferase system HPr (HPr) family protein